VKEAIEYADRAIEDAKRRGDTTINIIVGPSFSIQRTFFGLADVELLRLGKGLHSSGGVAKLKPAIEALMQKYAPIFHNVCVARAQV
jgi:hypothetical protein